MRLGMEFLILEVGYQTEYRTELDLGVKLCLQKVRLGRIPTMMLQLGNLSLWQMPQGCRGLYLCLDNKYNLDLLELQGQLDMTLMESQYFFPGKLGLQKDQYG